MGSQYVHSTERDSLAQAGAPTPLSAQQLYCPAWARDTPTMWSSALLEM